MLELAVFVGAFVQELVSPLPSFMIFVPAGASLQHAGRSIWYIFGLAFFIGISRVIAGLVLYWLSGRLQTWIYSKKASWLGVKRRDVNRMRKKLSKHGGWWTIFGLWAIPVIPGTVISLSAGFVKIPMWSFVTATYVGSIINALTYLVIGYYGLEATLHLTQ